MNFVCVVAWLVAAGACVCANEVIIYDAYFGKPLTARRNQYFNSISNGMTAPIAPMPSINGMTPPVAPMPPINGMTPPMPSMSPMPPMPSMPLPNNGITAPMGTINGTSTTAALCTVRVRACRKTEGRRVDGTCTNPHHPSRGATLTPLPRLLPARFGTGNTLRPASDGSPLQSTRHIRTTLMGDGHFSDHTFSSLATDVFVFSFVDNVELYYLLRYVTFSDCCINNRIPNLADPRCIPIPVPRDDPYLRRSGIRCMNLTRVETYQDYGCIPNTLPAERYNRATPLLDLSQIYGNTEERSRQIRNNTGGLLAYRMEGNREVPAGRSPFCINNRPENMEISCYNYGDDYDANLLPGVYLTAMWFFREHNRIARQLAQINPCWDDQLLFETARKINIAQWQYIYYYELIPEFIGYENALASGIIHKTKGYVNDFDPDSEPGVYREYVVGCRWFHTFNPETADLYRNHTYVGSRTIVNDVFRSGILAVNNTEADLTFRDLVQPADKFDDIVSPDIGNNVNIDFQAATDVPAIDMMRGRDAGFPPYNEYRKFCGMKPAKKFEDLHDTFDEDKVEFLSRLYVDVDDVELMVAVYNERLIPGGFVGPTLYCIMTHNLLLWRHSDKFFFEHGGFPAALTEKQLMEVKKTRIARILCDSGVDVTHIQPHAFLLIDKGNDFVSCDQIPGIDLNAWHDDTCEHKDFIEWKK